MDVGIVIGIGMDVVIEIVDVVLMLFDINGVVNVLDISVVIMWNIC